MRWLIVIAASLIVLIFAVSGADSIRANNQSLVYLPKIDIASTSTMTDTPTATPTPGINPFWTQTPSPTATVTTTVVAFCAPWTQFAYSTPYAFGVSPLPFGGIGELNQDENVTFWLHLEAPEQVTFGFSSDGQPSTRLLSPGDYTFFETIPYTHSTNYIDTWWVTTPPCPSASCVLTFQITWQLCVNEWPPGILTPTATATPKPTLAAFTTALTAPSVTPSMP